MVLLLLLTQLQSTSLVLSLLKVLLMLMRLFFLLELQLPASICRDKPVAVVPIDDIKTYGDLGVLIAPAVLTPHNGVIHVRAINVSRRPVNIPLLTPLVRYIIDPKTSQLEVEYTPEEVMDNIHVGPTDSSDLIDCKNMIRTRLSLFQSRLRYTHVMPHDIKTPDVDSGRTKAPFTASRQRPPREEVVDKVIARSPQHTPVPRWRERGVPLALSFLCLVMSCLVATVHVVVSPTPSMW